MQRLALFYLKELGRLRDIKNAALGGLCGEDVVELNPMDRHKKDYDNARLVFEERSGKDGDLSTGEGGAVCVNITIGGEEI